MDKNDIWKIALVVAMMAFSALFSGTETAYSSVNKLRLKNYESQGNKKAAKALRLANRFDEVLTAVLIGNNIVNIAASSVSTLLFVSIFGSKGAGISTAVITVLVLVFCEVLPKSYAKKNAEKISLAFASSYCSSPSYGCSISSRPCSPRAMRLPPSPRTSSNI